jgi:hypothetical protein
VSGSPDQLSFHQSDLGSQGGGRSRRGSAGRPGTDYQKAKRGLGGGHGRYAPNTSRKEPETSPTVARATKASFIG